MFVTETRIRVRYAETDQMGFVYYGNYAQYYEVGRAESMRLLGFTYRQMEDQGILMPIITLQSSFYRPARYDDLLTVKTILRKMPSSKIHFFYEVYNEEDTLINKGETVLAFIRKNTGKPCAAPHWFVERLNEVLTDPNKEHD